jgi:hypothetical protein
MTKRRMSCRCLILSLKMYGEVGWWEQVPVPAEVLCHWEKYQRG